MEYVYIVVLLILVVKDLNISYTIDNLAIQGPLCSSFQQMKLLKCQILISIFSDFIDFLATLA